MSLTIYSSWRGLISAVASPVVLLAVGGGAMQRVGPRLVPSLIVAFGLALGGIALFDYPRKSRFSSSGVERMCLLRRQLLPWERIDAIRRTRPDRPARRLRTSDPVTSDSPRTVGGLVAVVGRRRYLLVNRVEGPLEYDELASSLIRWHVETPLLAARPDNSAAPSYLYRRRSGKA